MEPGHEDREYLVGRDSLDDALIASMEPGHEDREYVASGHGVPAALSGLNGARS